MPADNNIHTPVTVQYCSQLFVFFKADMGKQHRKVNISGIIGIAYSAYFCRCLMYIHKGTNQLIFFRLCNYFLGDNTDKQYFHTVNFNYFVRVKQTGKI